MNPLSTMRSIAYVIALSATGCGESAPAYPIDAVVEDAPTSLTDAQGDVLCTVRILAADDTYSVASLGTSVLGVIHGSERNAIVPFLLSRDDGDGRLGAGDEITLIEGDVNLFGPDDRGTTYRVSITLNPDSRDSRTLFLGGAWVAD